MKNAEKIVVCENHHEVLLPWAQLFREKGLPSDVLTLDHHTDILPAFSRSETPGNFDVSTQKAVCDAIEKLHHDEHIDWALRAGIIASSTILAHECFTSPAHPAIRVVKSSCWPDTQEILQATPAARKAADRVLESSFLSEGLQNITFRKPFILDIDLDNFLTLRSLEPEDPSLFRELAGKADLITISRERDWVRLLRFPGEECLETELMIRKIEELLTPLPESGS